MDLPRFYSGTNVNRNREEGSANLMDNIFENALSDYLAPITTRLNNPRMSVPAAAAASVSSSHRHRPRQHQHSAVNHDEEDIYVRMLFDLLGIARGYNENMSDIVYLIRELIAEIRSMRVSRTSTTEHDHENDTPSPLIPPPPAAAYRAPITATVPPTINITTTRSTTRPIARRSRQDNPLFNALYTVFTGGVDPVFEDVVVRPTDEQINSSTRIVLFAATNDDILHARCPITLDPFEEGQEMCEIIHCGHKFSPTAIRNWFQSHVRCPVCRYDIRGNTSITPPTPTPALDVSSIEIPVISAGNRHIRSSHLLDNFTTEITNIIQNSIPRDASFNMTYSFEMYQSDDDWEGGDGDANLEMVD